MSIATSTVESSFGLTAVAFAGLLNAAATDATAIFRVVYGLDDGNDYGRYFFGQDPLITFVDAATNLLDLIDQSVTQQSAVSDAATALISAGFTGIEGFGSACDSATEALRTACANPGDAIRLLANLAGFAMGRRLTTVPVDPIGKEIYVLAARAVLRLRLAAVSSLIRATADYKPTSQQDAQAVRDGVCALIDALSLKCSDLFDDTTAGSLDAARVAIYEDLTLRGADLASVQTFQFGASLPAVVLAYQLYADAKRAGDLIARNEPPHGGFMPTVIEALTH